MNVIITINKIITKTTVHITLNTVVNLSMHRQLTTGYLKLSDILVQYTVLINKSTGNNNNKNRQTVSAISTLISR